MKYIVIRNQGGHLSGEVWDGNLVDAALEDGLKINVYDSPEAIERDFDLDEMDSAARWKAEAEAVGYPAARISEMNAGGSYWIKAEGNYKQNVAEEFYRDFNGAKYTYIAIPEKRDASFWLRYHVKYEKAHPCYHDPEARIIRSLASKILRGEA